MLKSEYSKPITVGELIYLNEKYGMTVDINDGEVMSAHFETDQGGTK